MTQMPLDSLGSPIPALGYADGGAQHITITSSNTRSTAFSSICRVISVFASTPAYIRLGDSTVTATTADHYLPAGIYLDIAVGPSTQDRYLAVLRADTDGTLHISERL